MEVLDINSKELEAIGCREAGREKKIRLQVSRVVLEIRIRKLQYHCTSVPLRKWKYRGPSSFGRNMKNSQ